MSSSGNTTVVTLQDGTLQGAPTMFAYISGVDNLATTRAADYFAQQAAELNVTDLIYVAATDGEEFLTVAGVTVGPIASVITSVVTPATGDVVGPGVSVNGNVVLFNGVTGKLIKDSAYAGANLPYAVLQSGVPIYGVDAGATDAYVITLSPVPLALTTGMVINFKANTVNTGNATLNVNGLGAKNILKYHDQTLNDGDIEANQIVSVIYDGTQFQMQSQSALGNMPYALLQNGSPIYAADTGAADAAVITLSPVPASYVTGMVVRFKAIAANATTTPTINVNGLGAKTIVKTVNTALAANDILANQFVELIYDGTNFVMLSPTGNAANISVGTALNYNAGVINLATTNANGYRLSLVSNSPVNPGNIAAATTLYWTPYKGVDVDIYSGSQWKRFQPGQLSITNSGLATVTLYDVFVDYNAGTPQLSLVAWASSTARFTPLAYQNGVLVLSGTPTSLYVGTIFTDLSSQFNDTIVTRYVWNNYNRIGKSLIRQETTASWNYTTATYRQANASTANQVNYIIGLSEDPVSMKVNVTAANSVGAFGVGIGVNSTTVNSAVTSSIAGTSGNSQTVFSEYIGYPPIGSNLLAWLEISQAAGTTSWSGQTTNGGVGIQSGMVGSFLM